MLSSADLKQLTCYAKYPDKGDYPRRVGMLCSLLYHSMDCTSSDLDRILCDAALFKSIEREYNPIMIDSDEKVWLPLITSDPAFSDIFDGKDWAESVASAEFDWLTAWAGDIIATLAIRYNVPMSRIIDVMGFERFLEFSPALHAQPDKSIFDVFDKEAEGKLDPPSDDVFSFVPSMSEAYILSEGDSALLASCLGVTGMLDAMMSNGWNAVSIAGVDLRSDIVSLDALRTAQGEDNDVEIGKVRIDSAPELLDMFSISFPAWNHRSEVDLGEADGIEVANLIGGWGGLAPYLEGEPKNDHAKYAQKKISKITFVSSDWIGEHASEAETIVLSRDEYARWIAPDAFYRKALTKANLR